tara:strand:+ start:414 stop:1220 length:807 start_codon:yes stop_codon:yes gene_type:complete
MPKGKGTYGSQVGRPKKGPGTKPTNQAAMAKRVQERRAANKKKAAERKAAKKAAKAQKRLSKAGVKVSKETAAVSGKVRRGVKGAEVTKGGAYAKYGKKSRAAKSFRSAFSEARSAGKKVFTWDGRSYSTARADDKKKTTPKKTGKTFGKEGIKKASKKATDVSEKKQYQTPVKDVMETKARLAKKKTAPKKAAPKKVSKAKDTSVGGKDAWKAPEDKYRIKKQLGGAVTPPTSPSIEPQVPSYKEGGKVESNPYGWPSRDARNGGKK